MFRAILSMIISIQLFVGTAFAFDLEKAKEDYSGAIFKVASIKEIFYENAPAIAISFTVPVDKERMEDRHLTLSGGTSDHWILSEDHIRVIFPFVTPEVKYTVRVSNLVQDINGQRLKYPQTKKLTTSKLSPSVNFTSSGHIISYSSPKHLPVTTLNVDEVTIDFFRIDAHKIPGMTSSLVTNGKDSYYTLNRLKKCGKLVHTGRFELKPRKNQRTDYNIDLTEIDALKAPGAYVAVMSEPGDYQYEYEHAFFMQTDIGLHVRRYKDSFDVYTQEISSGSPLENVRVDVTDSKGKIIDQGESDALGRVSFMIKSGQHHLIATLGDQMSVLPLNRNALDISGLKNAVTVHGEYQIYAWGPRELYRPGELLQADMLVRDFDGKLPARLPLAYTLYKPDGSKATAGQLQPSDTGFYQFSYQTAAASQTGEYSLRLTFADTNSVRYAVKVEEFLPERLDLVLFDGQREIQPALVAPPKVTVPVQSNYLYGAPASANKVDGFVTAAVESHPFKEHPTFFFGDLQEEMDVQRRDFKVINLDKEGAGTLTMENEWSDLKSPVRLRVNASVYETGGRPVTRSTRLTLLNGERFIGIEPQFEGKPDSETTVDIKVGYADREGLWQAGKDLQVTLIRQDRNWYWRHTDSRGWHWAWSPTPVTVFSKSISTQAGNTTAVSLPLKWGRYRVEVTDGTTQTTYDFKTSWSWWDNAGTGSSRKPDQVSLGFDKKSYIPGDTSRLRVTPPQDGLALVTVESSERVYYTAYMKVSSEGTVVEIPTESTWNRHDLYASVMVIRPGDMKTTPVPSRAFGMVHLPLKREHVRLGVAIDAPDNVQPNRPVTATVRVTGEGTPLPANTRVVVALTDVGVLNITRFRTPDGESYFFAPRRYDVDLFDNYGQIIDNLGPGTARQRFGGGFTDSGDELARGGDKPKSDVGILSFFSEPLPVDENGNVTVSFDLPGFNGKVRWMVMAFSDEQFGSTDKDTLVADKVVTQLAMPRFLARGDNSTIALDLRNMSGTAREVNLALTIGGVLSSSSDSKNLTLEDQEKITLRYPIRAIDSSGQGEIVLHLTGEGETAEDTIDITRTWRIGVRSPYPSVTRKTVAAIEPGTLWKPVLQTDDLVPESVRLQMNISNRPPIDFAGHFEYLLHYPYGCLEQSTSSGFPWVLASPDRLGELNLGSRVEKRFNRPYDDEFRTIQVKKAVARVLDCQKSNGSFGLWSSDSPEDNWLTVYATEFLHDAAKIGVAVDKSALQRADKRLRKYLKGNTGRASRWSDDPDHYTFAFRSYAGYVLSRSGTARLEYLRRLSAEFEGKTDDDGLSWMYMAAAFKMAGDSANADTAYKKALLERQRPGHRYYGEYGSGVRDLARMTELSMDQGFNDNSVLIRDLGEAVKDRTWLSTQERICLFRTAVLVNHPKEDAWTAGLITDKGTQSLKVSTGFNSLFDLPMFLGLQGIKAGTETLYANVSLVGDPIALPQPVSNGMTITRRFYDLDGHEKPLDTLKSGDLALIGLTVESDRRTPDGLVVDLLCAGLEIENQNLGLASVNMDEIHLDNSTVGEIRNKDAVSHEEFRDDRYVAAISLRKNTPVRLFYLVRAVTPGVYNMPGSYAEDMYRPYRHAMGANLPTMTVTE